MNISCSPACSWHGLHPWLSYVHVMTLNWCPEPCTPIPLYSWAPAGLHVVFLVVGVTVGSNLRSASFIPNVFQFLTCLFRACLLLFFLMQSFSTLHCLLTILCHSTDPCLQDTKWSGEGGQGDEVINLGKENGMSKCSRAQVLAVCSPWGWHLGYKILSSDWSSSSEVKCTCFQKTQVQLPAHMVLYSHP